MASLDTGAESAIDILQVGGRSFVAGLYWKPLRSARSYMAEAKKIGKDENWEMVTIRKGRTIMQAGFAPKGNKKLKGMYSLAAVLAGQLGENCLGAFKLPDGRYALVATRQGAILPGRDFIGSFEDVETELRATYSLITSEGGDFARDAKIYAPEEFNFAEESLDIIELLSAKTLRKEYRLRPLTFGLTHREIAVLGAGVIAVAAAGAGVKWWFDQKSAAEALAKARAALAEQANLKATAKTEIVKPWTQVPTADVLLQACAQYLDGTPLSLGGWLFNNARCAPGKAVATYVRNDATPVNRFATAAAQQSGQPPAIFEQGKSGAIETPIVLGPPTAETLQNTASLLTALTSHLQAVGSDATLTIEEVPFKPDPEKPDAPVPDWTTNAFTIQTTFPPERLLTGFDTSGIRVFEVTTSLSADSAQLNWILNGEIYGR